MLCAILAQPGERDLSLLTWRDCRLGAFLNKNRCCSCCSFACSCRSSIVVFFSSGCWNLLFRRLPSRCARDDHRHHLSLHYRRALNDNCPFQYFCDSIKQLTANVGMTHLRSSELHTDPDSIPLSKELLNLACLYIYIMFICSWTQTNFF